MSNGDSDDRTRFEKFKQGYKDGSLPENDWVIQTTKFLARKKADELGWSAWRDDVAQLAVLKLSTCEYSGKGSLEGYIRIVVKHLVFKLPKIEHQDKREELPPEINHQVDLDELFEEERLGYKVKLLLSRCPENIKWLLEIRLKAGEYTSVRKIADTYKKTRHEVTTAQNKLRSIWEKIGEEEENNNIKTAKFK